MCYWWRKEGHSAGKDSLEKDPSQYFAHGEFSLQVRESSQLCLSIEKCHITTTRQGKRLAYQSMLSSWFVKDGATVRL